LNEELRFHLDRQVEKYVRSGLSPEEATRHVRTEFGGLDQVTQNCREARGVSFIDRLAQDTRFALRMFARNPGFTTVAVLTLALGIGANTAVFSVVNAAMLRSLPVREPEHLVQVVYSGKHDSTSFVGESFSVPLFRELRSEIQVFTETAALDQWDEVETRAGDEGPATPGEPMKGQFVSAGFFSMLGINAVLGRTFLPDEDIGDGAHPVAVISYATWEHGYARDPDVLGRKLLARGVPLTIIGVAPRNFSGVNPGKSFDLWMPMTMVVKVMNREPATRRIGISVADHRPARRNGIGAQGRDSRISRAGHDRRSTTVRAGSGGNSRDSLGTGPGLSLARTGAGRTS
jgi:hypothetical protein